MAVNAIAILRNDIDPSPLPDAMDGWLQRGVSCVVLPGQKEAARDRRISLKTRKPMVQRDFVKPVKSLYIQDKAPLVPAALRMQRPTAMSLRKLIISIAAPAAMLGLSGCMTGLPTQVSRFQAMPAPAGQSFVIRAEDRDKNGGLEFGQYADLVRHNLTGLGYREASSERDATFIVTLDYGVDQGRDRVIARPDPFGDPWDYRGFGYRPYYGRYYGGFGRYRSPFFWGWHDPFWGGYDVESYTLYTSFLDMDIRRASDGQSLFEGHAQARSRSNELARLVPNLVEAMFTGFPGNNGETLRITVMPEREQQGRR